MLTPELIAQNDALKSLSQDQIEAIVTLSKNDEDKTIGQRIREVYDRLDADIAEVSGLRKDTSEKTYDFAKRAIAEVKKAGNGDLKAKIAELETQLREGTGDASLKKRLSDLEAQLRDKDSEVAQVRAQWRKDTEEKEKAVQAARSEVLSERVNNQFAVAMSGLNFKDEKLIPKEVRDTYIQNAQSRILAEAKADFIDDGKGGKVMVFKDANGDILRNPENQLQPYTAADLLKKHLNPILDTGRVVTGAGTKPANGHPGGDGTFRLTATTQVEADAQIRQYLVSQGVDRLSADFSKKQAEIRAEHKVADLPMQ